MNKGAASDSSAERDRLRPGQKVTTSGFEGTVICLYSDGPREAARMYEVRLERGVVCVCGSDIDTV